jgi:hypothetical protein
MPDERFPAAVRRFVRSQVRLSVGWLVRESSSSVGRMVRGVFSELVGLGEGHTGMGVPTG